MISKSIKTVSNLILILVLIYVFQPMLGSIQLIFYKIANLNVYILLVLMLVLIRVVVIKKKWRL